MKIYSEKFMLVEWRQKRVVNISSFFVPEIGNTEIGT